MYCRNTRLEPGLKSSCAPCDIFMGLNSVKTHPFKLDEGFSFYIIDAMAALRDDSWALAVCWRTGPVSAPMLFFNAFLYNYWLNIWDSCGINCNYLTNRANACLSFHKWNVDILLLFYKAPVSRFVCVVSKLPPYSLWMLFTEIC